MVRLPTLYSSYDECILDMDIFGKMLEVPRLSIAEMQEMLFEEFKRSNPLPTLEDRRYELSRLVSSNYLISYRDELDLQPNEVVLNLSEDGQPLGVPDFEGLCPLIDEVTSVFAYENAITDAIRADIVSKYDLDTGEDLPVTEEQASAILGSVIEDASTVLSEAQVRALSEGDIVEETSEYEVEEDSVDYDVDELTSESDDGDDFEEYEDELVDSDEEDDDFSAYEEDVSEEDDDFSGYEEDVSEDDSSEEDDFSAYEEDISEEGDSEEDDFSGYEEDESLEEDDFGSYEDELSDEGEEDDDFSAYETEEDDDFGSYEEEVGDEDDFGAYETEGNSEDYETEGDSDGDDFESYEEVESPVIEPPKPAPSPPEFEPELEEPVFEPDVGVVSPVVAKPARQASPQSLQGSASLEPTDIRQFLRKYPRSDINFVLQYFTKKQVNDAIKVGKIIKKGNILKL